jgi:hypothetical protein
VHIWVYQPKIKEDIGREFEGEVFIKPETGLPVAIEYSKGMPWVIPGNGAVKRVEKLNHLIGSEINVSNGVKGYHQVVRRPHLISIASG